MNRRIIVFIGLAFLIGLTIFLTNSPDKKSPKDADLEYFNKPGNIGPFSDAVKAGNLLFLSGKIGTDPETGRLVNGGIKAETHQVMKSIQASLESYGSSMDHVVKMTVMLADIDEWGAMNEVYQGYFKNHYPARSAFGASGLAMDARVEIECIAAIPERDSED